jgi:GTP cyclohydrolase I
MRGVSKTCSTMLTTALRGSFKDDRAFGAEVISLIYNSRRASAA